MVIYEVNLKIEPDTVNAFRAYLLDRHMQEVAEAGKFERAMLLTETETGDLVVQYHAKSMADIERYLADHAKRLRDDAMQLFAGKFTATRRFLQVVVGS